MLDSLSRWSQPDGWRPSQQLGGVPGTLASSQVVGDLNHDAGVDASDIVQEAFVEATQRIAEYDDEKMPFFVWLRFITLTNCADLFSYYCLSRTYHTNSGNAQNDLFEMRVA